MNKITKIAISVLPLVLAASMVLPVLAENNRDNHNGSSTSTNDNDNQNSNNKNRNGNATSTRNGNNKPIDVACVQNAIEKRDTSIIAAVDAYSAAIKSALQARKDSEKAAWGQTDAKARRTALKAAATVYRDALKTARKTFRNARQNAWKQFRTDRKSCGGSARSEEFGSQGQDESL